METILDDFASLVLNDGELDLVAEIANELADVAGQIIRKYYSSHVRFEFREKNGDGPVTYVDIEAMVCLPTPFTVRRPTRRNHGNALLRDPFIWVLDPIDGTSRFIGKDMCFWNASCFRL